MAAPFIAIDPARQSATQGIAVNISSGLQQVVVRVDQNGLESASEKLVLAVVAAIVALSVDPVQMAPASRQIGFRDLDYHVVMIRHQAIGRDS
jgi:hypothetical protein